MPSALIIRTSYKKVANAFKRRGAPVFVTQGQSIWHHDAAPNRDKYSSIEPLSFFNEVED